MADPADSKLRLLTLRERDCLRLLTDGLCTAEVAARLGISHSTLNKHLASARHKLAVGRTAQALLLYQREASPNGEVPIRLDRDIDASASQAMFLSGFLGALDPCVTFDEAWTVLRQHLRLLGIEHLNFGIVAEPPGQFTNGARVLRMDMPEPIPRMYEEAGGVAIDPTVRYVVSATEPLTIDNTALLRKLGKSLPRNARAIGEAMVDNDCNFQISFPYRDSHTRSPIELVYMLPSNVAGDFTREDGPKRTLLELAGRLFVDFVQTRRLLSDVPGLSNRQKEALAFAARGFTVDEAAEQMGVSTRFLEKTLAAARQKLGARTTPSAVFRALAYRALV